MSPLTIRVLQACCQQAAPIIAAGASPAMYSHGIMKALSAWSDKAPFTSPSRCSDLL